MTAQIIPFPSRRPKPLHPIDLVLLVALYWWLERMKW